MSQSPIPQSPIPQSRLDEWRAATEAYKGAIDQFQSTPMQNAFFAGMGAGVIPQLLDEIDRLKENR